MTKPSIYFLYKEPGMQREIVSFLEPFYELVCEEISFVTDGIKTKELYFQIDNRLVQARVSFLMIQMDTGLEVFDTMKRRIAIDFDNNKINYARKIIAKDPFLRAIGKSRERVLDISAGLGIDAVFLAQNGHDVVALERNPLLFLLLDRAFKNSQNASKLKLKFEFANGIDFIHDSFDCIYYDPMFPDKIKTALPKQEMVLFRQLVGNDLDSEQVLTLLNKTGKRVVVKRPITAPPIVAHPNNSFESKMIRFDIYEGK